MNKTKDKVNSKISFRELEFYKVFDSSKKGLSTNASKEIIRFAQPSLVSVWMGDSVSMSISGDNLNDETLNLNLGASLGPTV